MYRWVLEMQNRCFSVLVSLLSWYGEICITLHACIFSHEPNLPEPESVLLQQQNGHGIHFPECMRIQ